MKVKSVLFSEMRNKLGNQIIGTGWKGRMVFRAYKVPANPNTLAQQAHRDHTRKALIQYQTFIGNDPTRKGQWNTDALPRAISGYNLMMKLARDSYIQCIPEVLVNDPIDPVYFVKTDVSTQGMYVYRVTSDDFVEVVAPGELIGGSEQNALYTPTQAEVHNFFLVDARSKTIPPVTNDRGSLHNHWRPIVATGVSDAATCDVTAP